MRTSTKTLRKLPSTPKTVERKEAKGWERAIAKFLTGLLCLGLFPLIYLLGVYFTS